MSEKVETVELPGLRVTVDRVDYEPAAQTPEDRPHCFVYHVSIHNDSDVPVTIRGRKWVVTDSDKRVVVVEGDGVVGKFPTIQPGEKFSYNSYHLLATRSATAEGSYHGVDAAGRRVWVRIPPFHMIVPHLA